MKEDLEELRDLEKEETEQRRRRGMACGFASAASGRQRGRGIGPGGRGAQLRREGQESQSGVSPPSSCGGRSPRKLVSRAERGGEEQQLGLGQGLAADPSPLSTPA